MAETLDAAMEQFMDVWVAPGSTGNRPRPCLAAAKAAGVQPQQLRPDARQGPPGKPPAAAEAWNAGFGSEEDSWAAEEAANEAAPASRTAATSAKQQQAPARHHPCAVGAAAATSRQGAGKPSIAECGRVTPTLSADGLAGLSPATPPSRRIKQPPEGSQQLSNSRQCLEQQQEGPGADAGWVLHSVPCPACWLSDAALASPRLCIVCRAQVGRLDSSGGSWTVVMQLAILCTAPMRLKRAALLCRHRQCVQQQQPQQSAY